MKTNRNTLMVAGIISAAWLWAASPAFAHCDTMNGPVITTAKAALEKGDVTPVLKWVKKDSEAEIRDVFAKALDTGKIDELVKTTTAEIAENIRHRFERVMAAKKEAEKSVAAGREYVEAYVSYVHYVEGLHAVGKGAAHAHEASAAHHEESGQ